jgi:predicted nucleic acid-binding protein
MPERRLVDTTILVDHLRGREDARQYLKSIEGNRSVSVVSRAELFAGVFDEEDRRKVETLLSAFRVHEVTAPIAEKGGFFKRDYQPSHGTGIADALIAATAEIHDVRLVTLNEKHFPMLDDLIVPY